MSDYIVINTDSQPGRFVAGYRVPDKCSGHGLVDLLKDKGKIRGLEIGADIGHTSEYLLQNLPELELHMVDPYENYLDWNGNNIQDRQKIFEIIKERLTPFKDRYTLHRKRSDDAKDDFEDDYFDFIFIDGLHTYEQLTKDCQNFYSKVKNGCLFSGHDYNVIEGVNRAVKEFAKTKNKEILETECDVWYWIK